MPTIKVPYQNPLELYKKGYTQSAQFNSKHMNDYMFADTIYPWQQAGPFKQPWQLNDSIRMQLISDGGMISWSLYSCTGQLIDTANMQQVLQNADNPDEYIYQADIALNPYSEGVHYFEFNVGGDVILVSEHLIFSNTIENSLLLQYKHSSFREETYFETGFYPSIRIYGRLFYKKPGSKNVMYEDQVLNQTIVDSKTFDLYELQLSDEKGIPAYFIRKMNVVLGNDTLVVEDKLYAKANEGADLEETSIPNYAMKGWKLDMREQLNRRAKYFSTEGSTNQGVSVVAVTDFRGFIEEESGGSEFQLTDVI